MVNSKILLSVVIVLLIGVAAASYQITNNSNNQQLFTPTTPQEQSSSNQVNNQPTTTQSSGSQVTSSGQSTNGGANVKISSAQAKTIASKYIVQQGATAGTPQLEKINGNQVYVVPIIYNGKTAGEIWVDANTGKNVGGAGGAP